MTSPSLAYTDLPGELPVSYSLAAGQDVRLTSISAQYDGAGASGSFYPCASIYSQDGRLIGRYFPGQVLAAGDSAEVTFGPFLDQPSSSSTVTLPRAVWCKVTGAKSGGSAVTSPTSDTGSTLPLNSTRRTNADDVFGTGTSFVNQAPNNQSTDTCLLVMKPGEYRWVAFFELVNPSAVAPWPTQTSPNVDATAFVTPSRQSWVLPTQSAFPTNWTQPASGPPQPPVYLTSGAVGSPVTWLNYGVATVTGHGIVDDDILAGGFYGGCQLLLLNQSGGNVGISYELYVYGVTFETVARGGNF